MLTWILVPPEICRMDCSPGAWIPFIGNGSVMFKPHGMKHPDKNIAELKNKMGLSGVNMIRAKFPIMNPGKA